MSTLYILNKSIYNNIYFKEQRGENSTNLVACNLKTKAVILYLCNSLKHKAMSKNYFQKAD